MDGSASERTQLDDTGDFRCAVLIVAASGRLSTHVLPPGGRIELGRASRAGVFIDHPHVSRWHAALVVNGPGVEIQDLSSANGTWVRERRLAAEEQVPVAPGDIVRLGRSVCCWIDERRSAEPPAELEGGEPRVVLSEAMRTLHAALERIAVGDIDVLVTGETGVGKALVARALHERSPRAAGPFLTLDCAGMSEALLELELFGHERGAFPGAVESRPGLLERAAGGTIFLDEVGELPMGCQSKLLRPLEERVAQRVGSMTPVPIDVRFVAATNRDLEAEAAAGRFRRDLFFRLNGFTLTLPPLRSRMEEVVPIARAYVRFFSARLGRPAPELMADAEQALQAHAWPGNVRELRSAIERGVLLCGADEQLRAEHLHLSTSGELETGSSLGALPDQETNLIAVGGQGVSEQLRILRTLQACGGNQSRAAKVLGISRSTLIRKLDQYGVPRPRTGRDEEPSA